MSSTPMMAQYEAVKRQNPDCLLFFRLGDFYELFGEDARVASRLLNITLTARSSGEGRSVKVPMAGVPYHAADAYIQKLIRAGKKVAVCEQIGTPGPSMMKRELTRIITPGTVLNEGILESRTNNYLVAINPGKKFLGLAAADNSTGEFLATELEMGDYESLAAELERLSPSEIILPEGDLEAGLKEALDTRRWVLGRMDAYSFQALEGARVLKEHFAVSSLDGFGLTEQSPAAGAAGALLRYLRDTQKSPLTHILSLKSYQRGGFMRLDASTLRNLEIIANQEDRGKSGTLLEVLDSTVTAAGGRLLKRWLTCPLLDLGEINNRLDAVAELKASLSLREKLLAALSETCDIERILGRVGCLAANARDLGGLRATLALLPGLSALLGAVDSVFLVSIRGLEAFADLHAELDRALVEEPPLALKEGGMIRAGYADELDRLIADSHGGKETIVAIQNRERERSGIGSLKIQFNQVFGYYIEISKANKVKIPDDYERKQTLVNAERFTTPELKALETRVLHAEERRGELEYEIFLKLRDKVASASGRLRQTAARLAELDALLSLASAAAQGEYVRPLVDDSEILDLEASRHPVVEKIGRELGGEPFVANDARLDTESQQIMLITGPNMAGKSTYMRQVALLALMAQAGSFVPARKARIGLVDRIFTRVGASDRLARGMSTFLVEMTETANILRHASRRSLVILDEIGRGTSTFDGVAIAWSVAEHLHEAKGLGCRTLFATHYFELTELVHAFSRVKNYSVAVREWGGKIVFLHQIVPGVSEHSYGISVARLAGIPDPVISRAREVLKKLESAQEIEFKGAPDPKNQMNLFTEPWPPNWPAIAGEMENLDLNELTPLQALEHLSLWQKKLKD